MFYKTILFCGLVGVLSSCGGGGGSKNDNTPTPTQSSAGTVSSAVSPSESSSSTTSSSSSSSSSSSVDPCNNSSNLIFSECMNANYGYIVGAQYIPSYIEYTNSSADQQVQWSILDAGNTHNNVLDVNFADNTRQGQLFLGHPDSNKATQDFSQFQTGRLEFDLRVVAEGDAHDAVAGGVVFALRMDCLWPCAAHETLVTVGASDNWTHIALPIADLIASGLDISKVNNSLIIVPQGPQAHLHIQLDNVTLVAGGPVTAGPNVIFKEDFNGTITNWNFTNFVGAADASAGPSFGAAVTLNWNAINDTVDYTTTLNNTINITNKKASFQINCFKTSSLAFSYQMIATDANGVTATSSSNYATSLTPATWYEISTDLGDIFPNGFDATKVKKVGLQFIYLGGAPDVTQCYVDTIRITE